MHPFIFTILLLAFSAQVPSTLAEPEALAPFPTAGDDKVIIPETYIVVLKTGTNTSVRDDILAKLSDEPDHVYDKFLNGFAKSLSETEVELLRNNQHVDYIEENAVLLASGTVVQPDAGNYVYHKSAGKGTCAYVLDTGIYDKHPDFKGRAKQIKSFVKGQDTDGSGHGTHIAGIIGSATYGVAKRTRIFGIKVLNDSNRGNVADVIKGIEFIEEHKKKHSCPNGVVVSFAMGDRKSRSLDQAAAKLIETGVFVAVAAGNSNTPADRYSPASERSVCVVGGMQKNDALLYMDESFASNFGSAVDIFAPAREIISTSNSGKTKSYSGTSQAAAFIVGLAAYLGTLDGLSGTAALCNRIRQLATKDAIVDQRSDTVSLLAFNGAT
ncbi:subtilase family protein [Hirsutella rhossiliensis]|uniref:Subtilase family domain-containing protein n=1 Tax=Hirsutella rhossiliensis TaxID=111463 RepID=A0A9P8SP45_9HYPO|nr:subtilase family domain-containing protein [Hirsutella rhossiliensis]KAH0967821.1 subtilase family domain-containing protein [Hirsutella rhossiliensis]